MPEIIRKNLESRHFNDCIYTEAAAGDWVYLNVCVGNIGGSVEAQVYGTSDSMKAPDFGRAYAGVRGESERGYMMEQAFEVCFRGKYPARKTIATALAHFGMQRGYRYKSTQLRKEDKKTCGFCIFWPRALDARLFVN